MKTYDEVYALSQLINGEEARVRRVCRENIHRLRQTRDLFNELIEAAEHDIAHYPRQSQVPVRIYNAFMGTVE